MDLLVYVLAEIHKTTHPRHVLLYMVLCCVAYGKSLSLRRDPLNIAAPCRIRNETLNCLKSTPRHTRRLRPTFNARTCPKTHAEGRRSIWIYRSMPSSNFLETFFNQKKNTHSYLAQTSIVEFMAGFYKRLDAFDPLADARRCTNDTFIALS